MSRSGAFYRPAVRKAPQRARGGLKGALAALAFLALFAGGVGAAVATLRVHPKFAVLRVVMEGVPESHRAEVEELTDGWIGQPLLFADLDGPMRTLTSRTWVLRASARRLVPDSIEVKVVANPPVALARRGGELYTVDREGNWLAPYSGRGVGRTDDFVLLGVEAGAEDETKALARGATLLELLRREDPALLSRVSEVEVRKDGFALVDEVARARLLFGPDAEEPGHAAAIWRVFLALRPELERHSLNVTEADLRFADQIVLKAPASDGRRKT